jgi:cell division protein FtsA
MRKGLVVSPDVLAAAISSSVREAEAMLGERLPPAHIGVTGGHLTCLNAATAITRSPKAMATCFTQSEIDSLLMSTTPATAGDKHVVQVVPRSFSVDGLDGVHDPVGMRGDRISTESHIVIGDPGPMATLVRTVRSTGVTVKGVVLEHLASAEAVLTADERLVGSVLVDVGGGTSDLAVYQNGSAWYTAAIPVAGHHFTSDIAIGLGLPLSIAERIKIEHGSAILDGVDSKDYVDVEPSAEGEPRAISRLALNQLLRDRAVELVRLILFKLAEAGLKRVPPGGIVLTGGSSALNGLSEIVAEYGNCPVRIGTPTSALGLPEELEHSCFSTAIGLLLWSVRNRQVGIIAEDVSMSSRVTERLRNWLSKLALRQPTEVHA